MGGRDRNKSWKSFTSALGSLKDSFASMQLFIQCICRASTLGVYVPVHALNTSWCGAPAPGAAMWVFPPKLTCFNALNLIQSEIRCIYHTSNSRECMGVNGEALQLHVVYKKPHFFTTSHARIRISTTSHARIRIRYYKSHALCLNDKIIITIVPSYTVKNITRLLPLALLLVLHTRNNTDGNKLIFSGIALYYGDIYILR